MAKKGDGVGKKNSKLDSFLKKHLCVDTYERVRCTDSCIVTSENEDKQFKFVVLTDEWIYLTENPPKKVYEEVHMRNVREIELANDLPSFLQGDEQQNVQHVIIKHLAVFNGKKPVKSKEVGSITARSDGSSGSLSARSSRSALLSTRSESAISKNGSSSARGMPLTSKNSSYSLDAKTLRELGLGSANRSEQSLRKKKSKKDVANKKAAAGTDDLTLELGALDETDEENQEDDEEDDELLYDENVRVAVLHLYIMSATSPFLALVKGAWNNYLIKGTLEEDHNFCLKLLAYQPRTVPGLSERLELQFTQLRTELLNHRNDVEDVFHLLNELKNAVERQFFIKKMFWKSRELFDFLIGELQKYTRTSCHVIDGPTEENKNQRADELELVNLIMETMYLMFRETEVLSTRMSTLKHSKGRPMRELIQIILTEPQLPGNCDERHDNVGKHLVSAGNNNDVKFDLEASVDAQLESLREELLNHSTSVLFELFLMAQQGTFQVDATFFTEEWIVKIIEEEEDSWCYVERLVRSLLTLVSPLVSSNPRLTPHQAITVYHHVAVLDHILDNSEQVLSLLQKHFLEEFKYYIHVHIVHDKISRTYLVRPYIMHCFTKIVSRVLNKPIKF